MNLGCTARRSLSELPEIRLSLVNLCIPLLLHLVPLLISGSADTLLGAVELSKAEGGSTGRGGIRSGGAGDVFAFASGFSELTLGVTLSANFGAEDGGARGSGGAGFIGTGTGAGERVRVPVSLELSLQSKRCQEGKNLESVSVQRKTRGCKSGKRRTTEEGAASERVILNVRS